MIELLADLQSLIITSLNYKDVPSWFDSMWSYSITLLNFVTWHVHVFQQTLSNEYLFCCFKLIKFSSICILNCCVLCHYSLFSNVKHNILSHNCCVNLYEESSGGPYSLKITIENSQHDEFLSDKNW